MERIKGKSVSGNNRRRQKVEFPILAVLKKYLKTTTKGNSHWAICPFHQDTSPSLSISEERNLFKCFACNVSGDAIAFVMRIENCNYRNAIRKIGEILNLDVSHLLGKNDGIISGIYSLNEHVATAYHKYLFNKREDSKKALDYLIENRKLSIETIKKYRLGYAPQEDILETIVSIYKSESNLPDEVIKGSGLFSYGRENKRWAYFKDRVIFPILDTDKNVIGFSGRGEDPKYLNIRNNEVFSKSKVAFNIGNLRKDEDIYVFEGFIDLMKVDQELGLSNGIACMGGIMGREVFMQLRKYSNRIVLCLDNDPAGQNFTSNLGGNLLTAGFEVKVVDLLDQKEKDVDEIIDIGNKEILRTRMSEPIDFLSWIYKNRKPGNLDETKLLSDDCLSLFIDKDKGLKINVNATYAKALINQIFDWYKLIPEYEKNNLEEVIYAKRQEYLTVVNRNLISREAINNRVEIVETVDKFQSITNPFIKLAIKFQQLSEFIENEEMSNWCKEENRFWEYIPKDEHVLNIREINWLVNRIGFKDKEIEKPESISECRYASLDISTVEGFFDNYYTFYRRYLCALSEFYLRDGYEDITSRFEKVIGIKNEIKKLKGISGKFFLSSPFSKK